MRTAPLLPSLATLVALVALSGCGAAPGDEAFDQEGAALKSTPPTVTLKRGLFAGEPELECSLAYGPIIKIKPKGGLADDGSAEEAAGLVTYGPVITIKPKGFNGDGYDCPINQGDVILQRDFDGVQVEPGVECLITYGPVITIKPKGLTEEGREGAVETAETYGPVIKVKRQGVDDSYDCPVRYGNIVLKQGAASEAPQAAIECSEPGPLLSLTPPVR